LDPVAAPWAANQPVKLFLTSEALSFFLLLFFYLFLLLRKSRQQCQTVNRVRADATYDLFELFGFAPYALLRAPSLA
jgi:hypothetical protein